MVNRVLIVVALLILCFMIIPELADTQEFLMKIAYTQGEVSVKFPMGKWISAYKGMLLNEDNIIKTGRDAYCDISLDETDKDIISLGPETQITIGEYLKRINVSSGRVFTLLEGAKFRSTFEVRTPTASAGARGTAWETIADTVSQFNVVSETIYVHGIDPDGQATQQTDVSEGKSITVDEAGQLGEIVDISIEELERLREWLSRIKSNKETWKDILDRYDGKTADLFTEVLKAETGIGQKTPGVLEESKEVMLGDQDDMNMKITDKDITTQTYESSTSGSGQQDSR